MRRYTTVSQPDSVDGWLAVQLGDKLWFPGWNSAVMAETAARIVPIVTGQERAAASLQPSTPKTSSPLQAASIPDPTSGTSGATAAKTISNPNTTSVSTLHLLHHLVPAHPTPAPLTRRLAAGARILLWHGVAAARSA
jgi:hypothetical protein